MAGSRGPPTLKERSSVGIATNSTRTTAFWSTANRYRIPTGNGRIASGDKERLAVKIATCRVEDISGRASTTEKWSRAEFV
jgi:hypothetical protein